MSASKETFEVMESELGEYVEHPSPMACRKCGFPMVAMWRRVSIRRKEITHWGGTVKKNWKDGAKEYQVALICKRCDVWIDADVQREQAEERNRRSGSSVSRESQGRRID